MKYVIEPSNNFQYFKAISEPKYIFSLEPGGWVAKIS